MHCTLRLLLTATALAGAPAFGQDPVAPASVAWPSGHVLHDTDANGALWASAGTWKARFDGDGARFWAAVGSVGAAPTASFRLARVSHGDAKLPLTAASPARVAQRVTFDRGAVREIFDLRAEGMEQQFLFATLAGQGDLVLEVAVDTALAVERDGTGFALRGEHGSITYGAALAIDAAGARLSLVTTWRDGALQITVPAEFVASAELPLLVDPMIGAPAAVWTSGSQALSSTDIAFDASLGRYYTTYERAFSAVDHDVFVGYLDANMAWQGLLVIDNSIDYWTRPRIATLEAHDTACVVAEKSAAGASPFVVATRRIVGLALQAPSFLGGITGVDYRNPAIGGDASPTGPSRFLVAWERSDTSVNNNEIWFGRMGPDGAPFASTFLGTGIAWKRRVSVSKTCAPVGDPNARWALLYRAEPYQQSAGQLRVSMIRRDGIVYTSTPITGDTPNAGSEWAVSSGASHAAGLVFLATEIRVAAATGRGELIAHAFTGHGNVTVLAADVPLLGGSQDHRNPAVDSDGTRFAVACSARLSATDADLRVRTLALIANQLVVQDSAVPSYSYDFDAAPAICASGKPNAYGMAWTRHTAGANHTLMCQAYNGVGAGSISTRATGCGSVGITTLGVPALGETFTLSLQASAPLTGFFFGQPVNVPIPVCVGCTQGAQGLVLYGTSLPITIPTNVQLVGIVVAAQGFAVDLAGLPCLGQIALSHTVDFRVR